MKMLLGLLLPLIIITSPLIAQIYFGKKARRNGDLNAVIIIGIVILLAGLFTPVIATFISACGLSWNATEPICVIGAGSFLFFGYVATIITIPLSIYYVVTTRVRKNIRP